LVEAVEVAAAHAADYPARKEAYGPALAGLLEMGRGIDGMTYHGANVRRLALRGRVAPLFEAVDMMLMPAHGEASPTNERMMALTSDPALQAAMLRFTFPIDILGYPALTMPCGRTGAGMPIGCQLVGPPLTEEALVRAGMAFQGATDWHRAHPAAG